MINKNIFNPDKQLENQLNQIIYAYLAKGSNVTIPANAETFVKQGYAGNVNIYPIIRKIVQPAIGVKWSIVDDEGEPVEGSDLEKFLKKPNPRHSIPESLFPLFR